MNYFVSLLVMTLILIFLFTALDKIIHWKKHINVIEHYNILKKFFIKPSIVLMVSAEFFICITLFYYGSNLYNLIVFLSLMFVYTTAIIINLYRGNTNISCGCGGFLESSNLSYKLVIRNSVLVLLFLLTTLNSNYSIIHLSIEDGLSLLIISICIILLWSIIKEFFESKKVITKILKVYYLGGN